MDPAAFGGMVVLPNRLGYVIIYTADMGRSVAFYNETLGLPLRYQTPYWTEFALEGTTLALHHAEGGRRTGEYGPGEVSLSWVVEDIEATHAALVSRGVQFTLPPKRQDQEGIILAIFEDPDGCKLSLCQPLG